jgi:hypothetical protein
MVGKEAQRLFKNTYEYILRFYQNILTVKLFILMVFKIKIS